MQFRILSASSSNPKTSKSLKFGYDNAILHLAPYTTAGVGDMCPSSTTHCRKLCLYHCGHGGMLSKKWKTNNVVRARVAKTRSFVLDRDYFMQELDLDISFGKEAAEKKRLEFCVRLNGTSDLEFENMPFTDRYGKKWKSLIHKHWDVQFYDYTKIWSRIVDLRKKPRNLDITLSFSGENERECKAALAKGLNVAVIFNGILPEEFWGCEVIDGDESDLRFLDDRGVVVGLTAKGIARRIPSACVVET